MITFVLFQFTRWLPLNCQLHGIVAEATQIPMKQTSERRIGYVTQKTHGLAIDRLESIQ
jgi:hypothetical protein